jgi:hypothetical protein
MSQMYSALKECCNVVEIRRILLALPDKHMRVALLQWTIDGGL